MKKRYAIFQKLILLILVSWASLLNAQQYPVQATPVLLPPYSLRLGDYATTADNKLQLQLLMKDLMEPSHRINIRFSLESGLNAVTVAQSNAFVTGLQEVTLYPGTPLMLTNIDLRPLFRPENLTGISASAYARPLPEGMYRFCFQVFDAYTGRALSAKSAATAYLVQYEPPLLNLPLQGEKIVKPGEFQSIVFQWMPRQMAPNTRYIFTLKELWDNQRDPVSGFLSSRALWQEETYAPTLYYGMDKTALIPGRRYAWQVQARSGNPVVGNSATEDNGVYKNNGLSEIFYFDYTENCTVPVMLTAKNTGRGKTEIRWSLPGNSTGGSYLIQYRRKGSTAGWSRQESYQAMCLLTGLKDETEYEYRVGSVCGNLYQTGNTNMVTGNDAADNAYAFSGIQTFVTDSKQAANDNTQCGILPQVDITNKSPLQTPLGTNEVFMAGDFPVTVLQSQGTSGTYAGYGYIQVPYLADTKLKVTFNNIRINTDKQLIGGTIETTYDVNESSLSYVSQSIGETFGDRGLEPVSVDYVISGVEYIATPPPGKIVITGNSGKGNSDDGGSGESSRQELPAGKDYAITDKDGNVWHVDEEGNVTKGEKVAQGGASNAQNTGGITGGGANAEVEQYTAKGVSIQWYETPATKYAYDTADNKPDALKAKYPAVTDADGNTVYVSYKAVVNRQTDVFGAKVIFSDPALKGQKVIFKTLETGQEIAARNGSDDDYTLTLRGTMNYAEEDVIAVLMPKDSTQKQQVIGSFKLVHLEPKEINVTLVPTDDVSKGKLENIRKVTDTIYSKVGVTVNFSEDAVFDITPYLEGNAKIPTEKNSLLSTYSSVQQAINRAYDSRNDNRYILFVTDRESSTGQMGYMRLGGQFGYIFQSPAGKTAAHELGHGIFKLEHPWEQYGTTEGDTGLLMDYSNGTVLTHLDWKQINDPKLKLYAFQGQDEGEVAGNNGLLELQALLEKLGQDGFILLKKCEKKITLRDGPSHLISIGGIDYTYISGTLKESEISIQSTPFKISEEKLSGEIKIKIDKDDNEFLLLKQGDSYIKCNVFHHYDLCNGDVELSETFFANLQSDILKCSEEKGNKLKLIQQAIQEKLDNQFYNKKGVKLCIKLRTTQGDEIFLLSPGIDKCEEAEVFLNIDVNLETDEIKVNIDCADDYLKEYVGKWQEKAQQYEADWGEHVDVEELRRQVIQDLEDAGTAQSFLDNLVQSADALIGNKIAGFVEGVQVSQKIAKNVWDEGTINKSTWHSTKEHAEEHTLWPGYAQFNPFIGGAADGVIDEVVGIPVAIKGVYGIMTDKEQREAMAAMFTKDGLKQMLESMAQDAKDIAGDNERLAHAGGNTTVKVATMLVPGMQITKVAKLDKVVDAATEGLDKFRGLKQIKTKIDNLINKSDDLPARKKAMKDFFEEMDPEFVNLLMDLDIDNFDSVLKEMAQTWRKFHGEKFMFDNMKNRGDDFVRQIQKFEAIIDDGADYAADIKLKPNDLHPNGFSLEYKSWKKNSFGILMKGDQFKNQLKSYIKSGNFEYVIDAQKLIKDGVPDPSKFVKGEFQKVFKENAKDLFEQNPNLFSKMKITDDQFINSYRQLERVASDEKLFNKLIGDIFIKIE